MIILLFGKDTYRSKKKLKEIIEECNSQQGVSYENFEASEIDYRGFKDKFRQASMFSEKKLAIVREVFEQDDFKEKFLEETEQWNESEDTIILFAEEVKKSDPLFKFIKKNAQWEQFELLKGKELKDWAFEEFENYEVEIEPQVLSVLIDFVGSDLWRLANEIQKLANYKKQGKIEKKDVELLVKPALEADIFNTIDAFASKNNRKALRLVQEHLDQGDSPLYILSMINYQLRNLLSVKQLKQQEKRFQGIQKETDLNGFVVKKTLKQCRNFNLEEIKRIYHRLFEVDLDIKTGKTDKEDALKMFVAGV